MNDPDEFALWSVSVLKAAAAHKSEAMARGFSEEAAEAMAVTLHSVLMASIYDEVDTPEELDAP
jgi:hypothetical protein